MVRTLSINRNFHLKEKKNQKGKRFNHYKTGIHDTSAIIFLECDG